MTELLEKLEYSYGKSEMASDRFNILQDYLDSDLSFLEIEDNYGNNIFHYLVKNADSFFLETIIILLKEHNKKITFRTNCYGYTPLFSIKDIRNPFEKTNEIKAIVRLLVNNGCNINKRDESGKMFYHYLASNAFFFVFEELNSLNVKYDKVIPTDGYNVLHIALESINRIDYYKNNIEKYSQEEIPYLRTIKAILDSGIDVSVKTNIGKTAYEFALETKNRRASMLVTGVESSDKTFGISIFDACLYGYSDIVKEYIERNIDLNGVYDGYYYDLKNMTAIEIAAKNLHADILEILINDDPTLLRINSQTGKSAFYYFAKSMIISKVSIKGSMTKDNYKRITRLFLNNSSFIDSYIDDEYHTPINFLASIANRFNHVDNEYLEYIIFRELLKYNPDLTIADINGNTVLHNLFSHLGPQAVRMLEELKAFYINFDIKNKNGETPFMLLRNSYRDSDAILLLEAIEDESFDLSIVNNEGKTALTILLENGKEEIAKKLVELGGI